MTAKRKFRRGTPVHGMPHAYCSLMPLLAAGLIGGAQAQTTVVNGVTVNLPGSTQLPGNPTVLSGSGTINTVVTAASAAMNIQHQTQTLMLGFPNFNVGSNASVNVSVANGANIAPNSIRTLAMIGGTDPSVVAGAINSPGQFYMFNSNGILFTGSAQVNVGGLLASTLSLSQENLTRLLNNGLPSVKGDSLTFNWTGGDSGLLAGKGFVAVDAGAKITTGDGGKVVLLAPATVQNLGLIQVDKTGNPAAAAEAILAAGGKVVLTAPDDPNLRGLLVETSSAKVKDSLGNDVTVDGKVVNRGDSASVPGSDNGRIDMGKGVVSLAALAVNQEGRVNATQAVNVNGQIMLMAGKQTTDRLTVTQTGGKAEIDWKSGFGMYDEATEKTGVKQGQTLEFIQSGSGAVAYNFVNDADRKAAADGSTMNVAERTVIDGTVKANGQIFIVNEKGIEFGSNARVAAGSLVATGLGVNSEVIDKGLFGITEATKASLQFYATDLNENSDHAAAMTAFKEASITVQNGAQISTGDNGFAILAGSRVDQGGVISTPKGQTILAAGAKVYLKAPYSQPLRGFSAEVDPLLYVDGANNAAKVALRDSAVHVVNNSGTVQAALGNITLVGYNLNNAGNLLASTSATLNGSVRLLARDNIDKVATTRYLDATGQVKANPDKTGIAVDLVTGREGGTLTLEAGSRIEIGLDGSGGEKLTATQTFLPSSVEAMAGKINMEGDVGSKSGASIVATGGKVGLHASRSFSDLLMSGVDALTPTVGDTDTTVFVGSGAKIDVSGATAQRSVKDLFVQVELRGDELAGNPVQRDGPLRGQMVTVDIRDAVKIADLSGYIGQVGQTVDERAATGGTIAIRSAGNVVVKQGAELNVSGGRVNYAAADVQETFVIDTGGNPYRLNDARTDIAVGTMTAADGSQKVGLDTQTHSEAAYTEGKSAGTIELSGNRLAVAGTLKGTTVRGERQRTLGDPSSDRTAIPLGAKLIVRDGDQHYLPTGSTAADIDAAFSQAQMAFIKGTSTTTDGLSFGSAVGPKLELSESIAQNGFSRFDLKSDGKLEVGSGINLNLGPGGEFVAKARQIEVNGSIVTPGGKIDMSTVVPEAASLSAGVLATMLPRHLGLSINQNAVLSTAGTWVNDYLTLNPAQRAVVSITGGEIKLNSADDLYVAKGARLDVSGGARVKSDGKLEAGNAGKVGLTAGAGTTGVSPSNSNVLMVLEGSIEGYSLGKGGSFSATAPRIRFGTAYTAADLAKDSATRVADNLVGAVFDPTAQSKGGFYSFSFEGTQSLTVGEKVTLSPAPLNWSFDNFGGYRELATGSSIRDYASLMDIGANQRIAPTSLTLAGRDILLDKDSLLRVDAGGSVVVTGGTGQMTILGTIEALGGSIKLSRSTGKELAYSNDQQSRSIYLGENSQLLAGGTVKLGANTERMLGWGVSRDMLLERGLYTGKVINGGSVDIDAGLGYVITRSGSVIDVSGTTATLNMPSSDGSFATPTTVGAGGGKLNFAASEGLILDGSMRAAGGAGTTGGSFSLKLGRNAITTWNSATAPASGARTVILYDSKGNAGGSYEEQWSTLKTPVRDPETKIITSIKNTDASSYLAGAEEISVPDHNGFARLDTARLAQAGFGSVAIQSQDTNVSSRIGFEGNVNLSVANQIRLDSPNYYAVSDASKVTLEAAALLIGNQGNQLTVNTPTLGKGSFTAKAKDIGFVGNSSFSGFGSGTKLDSNGNTVADAVRFESTGEMHFDSVYYTRKNAAGKDVANFDGSFLTSGTLELVAARLSPSTFSTFTVDMSSDAASALNISRPVNPDTLGRQLAGAGSLTFKAKNIKHDGTIEAPLGEVRFLSPNGKVTLTGKSITSVAATDDILLGQTTQSGSFWKYAVSSVNANGETTSTLLDVKAPNKQVLIDAADVDVQRGATINVSGGGEALAFEFSPGSNGKVDILAAANGDQNTFAIIPGWDGNFAPTDNQNMAGYDGSLKAGDKIELSNNALGLNGRYTLLPARYALLKGAVLVTLKSGSVVPSTLQTDGSVLTSAVRVSANKDGSYSASNQSKVMVELAGSSVVARRAKYVMTKATDFFMADDGTRLPGDAGRLSVAGRSSLAFDPTIIAQRMAQIVSGNTSRAGRGAELDLAAPKLALTDSTTAAPGTDWTVLDKDKLNALGVSSIMLGGLRSGNGGVVNVETVAKELRVDAKGDALKAAEVALVAHDNLTVAEGSQITATAGETSANASYAFSGDGAFVRVASGNQATITRTGVARTTGNVNVEANTRLSGKALMLDATGNNQLKGALVLANQGDANPTGGAVSIGANRISVVGDNRPAGSNPTEGLSFDNQGLAAFAGADEIRLNSYSTFDLYGDATLGSAATKSLVIGATGIKGIGSAGNTATLTAQKLRLENPNPAAVSFISTGTGTLNLVAADQLILAGNATSAMRTAGTTGFRIGGFNTVNMTAAQEVKTSGIGVTEVVGSLNVNAGRILAASGSDQKLVATGALTVMGGTNTAASSELGGKLALRGNSVDIAGRVVATAGGVDISANNAVNINSGAVVNADGATVKFADTKAYASAGSIVISSDNSNVGINAGSQLSVSGGEGGDAGRIVLKAENGAVSVAAGALRGTAIDTAVQGDLSVKAKTVNINELATAVRETAANGSVINHLRGLWDVRRISGDVTLTDSITAAGVSIAADTGHVTIGDGATQLVNGVVTGKSIINASGKKGGRIELYAGAGKNVTLAADAELVARGNSVVTDTDNAGTRGEGGVVILGTSTKTNTDGSLVHGAVVTTAGSIIDVGVADGSLAQGGKVVFRANESASTASRNNLNIRLSGAVLGANDVSAQFVRVINAAGLKSGTTSGSGASQILGIDSLRSQLTAANTYDYDDVTKMANLRSLLGFGNATQHVRAGVELVSTGDFTIPTTSSDIDLGALRFLGEAGVMTVKAGGNIVLNKSLSDGFSSAARTATLNGSGDSWSYRMVAGADTSAANPMTTSSAATNGNITLATNVLLRTGTGSIDLAAAKDIRLVERAAIYTAGREDSANNPQGFVAAGVQSNLFASFGTKGGDISMNAGGNVLLSRTATSDLAPTTLRHPGEWLVRAGGTKDTQWYTNLRSFQQGVATLGGGDIEIRAGQSVLNLEVALPTNGRINVVDGVADQSSSRINGGGDLKVSAGSNVDGGLFYVETGSLAVSSRDKVSNLALGLGNTSAVVTAVNGASLNDVFNPMSTKQAYVNDAGSAIGTTGSTYYPFSMRIGTYGVESRLNLLALNEDAQLLVPGKYGTKVTGETLFQSMAPGRVQVAAFNGNIEVGKGFSMAPASDGQLDLFAKNNVTFKGGVTQYDVAAERMPSISNPVASGADTLLPDYKILTGATTSGGASVAGIVHAATPWHATDTQPSRIVAVTGDIQGAGGSDRIELNEGVMATAGRDIIDLAFTAQHLRDSDVSSIVAGRDVRFVTNLDRINLGSFSVSGKGALDVIAGRHIDLATANGIVTRGNADNPYLPEQGASLYVAAGTQAGRYDAVLDLMQSLGNTSVGAITTLSLGSGGDSGSGSSGTSQPSGLSANQVRFMMALRGKLEAFVDSHAEYRSGPRETDASKAFKQDVAAMKSMPETLKAAFFREQYFDTLRSIGREVVTTRNRSLYADAYGAIETLFPAATQPKGNINMFYSQIRTEQGGNIDLLAPGGSITVGIANPSTSLSKPAASQGLFTIRGGNISAYAQKDFLVNQSRVFTLDGGNILVWANTGNIDAGNGAKTVNSTPPPALVIRNGQIILDTSNSVSGSGIGALSSRKDSPPADIDLYAPQGAIDAGDAGVRGTGRGFFDGETIKNGNNFNLAAGGSGLSSGASVPPPAISTTPASQAADSKTSEATAAGGDKKQGILTVEVMDSGPDVPVGNTPATGAGGKSGSGGAASDKKKEKS